MDTYMQHASSDSHPPHYTASSIHAFKHKAALTEAFKHYDEQWPAVILHIMEQMTKKLGPISLTFSAGSDIVWLHACCEAIWSEDLRERQLAVGDVGELVRHHLIQQGSDPTFINLNQMAVFVNQNADMVSRILQCDIKRQAAHEPPQCTGHIIDDKGRWPPQYNNTMEKVVVIGMEGLAHYYRTPELRSIAPG